jgi:hypothetical protein
MQRRINNQYSVFLDTKPTFATYYHINTNQSTVDKGLQTSSQLTAAGSSIRYNKIKEFPIYLSDTVEASIQEEDFGMDIEFDSSCIILPHTLHPLPDDYFVLTFDSRFFTFRITHVDYDTIKSNSFFKCQFELRSVLESDKDALDGLVVNNYTCIFDNIGTMDKSLILDDEFETLGHIKDIMYHLRDEYLGKFRDKRYNALIFKRAYGMYLYDPMLNCFCNNESIFILDKYNTADTFLLYEERRELHEVEYENSIYDRLVHKELNDINEIGRYYDMESCQGTTSIFAFNNDSNAKRMIMYPTDIGPFGNVLDVYLPANFISALELVDGTILNNPLEDFVFTYMTGQVTDLKAKLDSVDIRRLKYNLFNFIFVPMVLYCLKELYQAIITNTSVIDENMLTDEHLKKHPNI